MKKLNLRIEVNNKYWDEFCSVQHAINDLIDLVNSQQEAIGELQTEIGVLRNMVLQSQEAIEKLESKVWTAGFIEKYRPALEFLAEADTHRTEKEEELESFGSGELRKEREAIDARRQDALDQLSREKTGVSYDTNDYKWEVNKVATNDTHRTVTLRIPKGMRVGEAITSIPRGVGTSDFYLWLCKAPDTDLQKALDEVQPNE